MNNKTESCDHCVESEMFACVTIKCCYFNGNIVDNFVSCGHSSVSMFMVVSWSHKVLYQRKIQLTFLVEDKHSLAQEHTFFAGYHILKFCWRLGKGGSNSVNSCVTLCTFMYMVTVCTFWDAWHDAQLHTFFLKFVHCFCECDSPLRLLHICLRHFKI